MAEYPPPQDDTPIFNSQEFLIPLNATISKAEADATYLARTDTAISIANTTSFTDNITVGNAIIDYIPAQGLQIKPTVNSEAVFLRVLNAAGVTKQRIECNATHQHLYDQTRITDSAAPSAYTTLQQSGSTMTLQNAVNNSTFRINSTDGFGGTITTFQASVFSIIMSPTTGVSGLNGIQCNGAIFGRDDTVANTFNGTLLYTRHPLAWTIDFSKAVIIPTSNVTVDVISTGTPITAFNTLSNGVWRVSCTCNNAAVPGVMTSVTMGWGTPTGATIINGSTSQLYHQITAGLTNFSAPFPDIIIRTTGNGVTGLVCNFTATYSVQPTITFNLWAIKIG
jgi:hypothetical protein